MQVRIAPAMPDSLRCVDNLGTASWEPRLFTRTGSSAGRRTGRAGMEQGGKSQVSIQLGQILSAVKGPEQTPESAPGKA